MYRLAIVPSIARRSNLDTSHLAATFATRQAANAARRDVLLTLADIWSVGASTFGGYVTVVSI